MIIIINVHKRLIVCFDSLRHRVGWLTTINPIMQRIGPRGGQRSTLACAHKGRSAAGWVGGGVSFFFFFILIGPRGYTRVRQRRRIAVVGDTPTSWVGDGGGEGCGINNDSVILSSLIKISQTRRYGSRGRTIWGVKKHDLSTVDRKNTIARL